MADKVLLTGISGWIAKHIAIDLLKSGYEVLGTVRENDLIEETKEFIRKNWPEVDSEYNGRHCSSIQIVDPFTGDNLELGKRTKSATEVKSADYPKIFKSKRDSEIKTYKAFLLEAEGDYNEKEYEAIKQFYKEG